MDANRPPEFKEVTAQPELKSEPEQANSMVDATNLSNAAASPRAELVSNNEASALKSVRTDEPDNLKFPRPMQYLFLLARISIFLSVMLVPIGLSSMEILVKVASLIGAWVLTGATRAGGPRKAFKFLKKKLKSDGSILPEITTTASGKPEETFERLLDALKLEKYSRITECDPINRQITITTEGKKYGADFERKIVCSVSEGISNNSLISLKATTESKVLSFQAQYVIGREWVDLRLRMLDYKFLEKLHKRVLKRLNVQSQELKQSANAMCCEKSDCACQSFAEFDHPIKKWGFGFVIKSGLLIGICYELQIAICSHIPAAKLPPDIWVYWGFALWLQVGLAGIWSVLFHRLFSNLKKASKGVFKSPSWHTVLAPTIINQATLPILLVGAAFVCSIIFNLPGVREIPQRQIPALSGAIMLVLGASIAPIFLGSLAYLSLFHRVSAFLKTRGAQAPNAMLSAIQVSTAIFAPTFLLLWTFDVNMAIALPLIQLVTYIFAFNTLNSHYEAVRAWIHTEKVTAPGAIVGSQPSPLWLFVADGLTKAANAIEAFTKIDAFKLASALAISCLIAGLSDGSIIASINAEAERRLYDSKTARVMVAGERPSASKTVFHTRREIHKGEIFRDSDIEELKTETPGVDAIYDRKYLIGAKALTDIAKNEEIVVTDVPFTKEQEMRIAPMVLIPLPPDKETVEIAVATRHILAGELFCSENTHLIRIPTKQLAAGTVQSQGALIGCVASIDIPYRGVIKNTHVALMPSQSVKPDSDDTTKK